VREPHEYAAGHIPGAINLPLSRFSPGQLPSGKPIVLVCQAAAAPPGLCNRRSALASRRFATMLRHGGWKSRGGSVVG